MKKKNIALIAVLIVGVIITLYVPDNPYTPEDRNVIEIKEVHTSFGEPTSAQRTIIHPTDDGWRGWYGKRGSIYTGELIKSTEPKEYYRTKVSTKKSKAVLQRVRQIQRKISKSVSTENELPVNYSENDSVELIQNVRDPRDYTCRSSVTNDSGGWIQNIKIEYPESPDIVLRHVCSLVKGGEKYEYRIDGGEYTIKTNRIGGGVVTEARRNTTYYEANRVVRHLVSYANRKIYEIQYPDGYR